MVDVLTQTNAQIAGSFTNIPWMTVLGWIVFFLILGVGGFLSFKIYNDRKIFNKRVTVCDIVGSYYEPVARDVAKIVKIGSGGFEILYLKKLKIYRVGYGGRVGKTDYYFFIQPDGYWYNGMMSAGVNQIDINGGLIPIVTTNPSMRAQYTSLEKQIDHLHAEKKSFWEGNKVWMIPLLYIMVMGICGWLMYKEIGPALSAIPALTEKQTALTQAQTDLTNQFAVMLENFKISSQNAPTTQGGLVPV